MSPLQFVLATANPDKAREIAEILGDRFVLVARPESVPDVAETGLTLLDNARLKARAIEAATGQAALADDTGLEVDALGGAPGVMSARYSGPGATYASNVAKLLAEMAQVETNRRARFRTVAVAAWPDGTELHAEGVVEGEIAPEGRGDQGFGYDPVFVPDEGGGLTFAEMSAGQKHRISHRARAFRSLALLLDGRS
jgi:XTP/dITP diphosphohydrolase